MFCPARYGNAEELLHRQAVGMLLIHRRDIVQPVEIGQRLQVGLGLYQLFRTPVKQADMRIDTGDDLAIKLEHEAQHAMRRRMLRSEVDLEGALVGLFGHGTFAFSSPGNT